MEGAPGEANPPLLQAPSAKEKRYDRQLRLWGANGQRALEESHVLLVVGQSHGSNSSVAGVETLKNLILPGVGSFTIADSAKVTEADLGINFFLEANSLGKPRAEETQRLLQELNPDVTGYVVTTDLSTWLEDPKALSPYQLILVCAPIPQNLLHKISDHSESQSTPLICIHSEGFYSMFFSLLPSILPVVDTHPDPDSIQDLRLLAPWPELSARAASITFNLSSLSDHDHGHIPYIYLLLHYLEEWKSTHSSKAPDTFKEKVQFRDLVRTGARTSSAEGAEENFDEACAAVLKSVSSPTLGSGCREMFQMDACQKFDSQSSSFWIIAEAIKTFYETHGNLPLPGSLPDMKARSADYIELQNIYKSKARKDLAEVVQRVRTLESGLIGKGRQVQQAPLAEVEAFCKNAAHIKVIQGTSLPEFRTKEAHQQSLNRIAKWQEDETSLAPIFLALRMAPEQRAAQMLIEDEEAGVPPPAAADEAASGIAKPSRLGKVLREVQRAQGGELHNIASLTGGMVAQEAIKILARQYVPVNNVCVFDGISSRTEVMTI